MTLRFFKLFMLVNIFIILTNLFETFIRFFSKNIGYNCGNTKSGIDLAQVGRNLSTSGSLQRLPWQRLAEIIWGLMSLGHLISLQPSRHGGKLRLPRWCLMP